MVLTVKFFCFGFHETECSIEEGMHLNFLVYLVSVLVVRLEPCFEFLDGRAR